MGGEREIGGDWSEAGRAGKAAGAGDEGQGDARDCGCPGHCAVSLCSMDGAS